MNVLIFFLGLNGYIYKLTKVDNYFTATSFRTIVIPRCFADIDSFEEVLVSLFYFVTRDILLIKLELMLDFF